MDYRVRRGYTAHLRQQVYEEGSVIADVTTQELADHGIRLEDADHDAMRAAMSPDAYAQADVEARKVADEKYAQMYERTLAQSARDVLERNPTLANRIATLVAEQQCATVERSIMADRQSAESESAIMADRQSAESESAIMADRMDPESEPNVKQEGVTCLPGVDGSTKKKR